MLITCERDARDSNTWKKEEVNNDHGMANRGEDNESKLHKSPLNWQINS